jgi:hypothetical protein
LNKSTSVFQFNPSPPNQSLKLTEIAVDDFAARQFAENDMISKYVRATNCMAAAVRRRSLAPVRYASLAAGEASIKEGEMKD